ncbi:MAG TPA: glycosyltransferase family 2 protein [Flavobacteriaceae bacterium]|nr:glycosyltransferase family 2 protein [Flavobacteriaceae bacterium]HIN99699.1 glycosyltransferase family 2 protein [Flavobacteriaceae bacterium]
MEALVSIIVPNYNHAPFLKERLHSIFNQTHQDIEVILLDDASTDDSVQILEPYKNHPKVSHFIVNDSNTGSPFLQWKKGLELAVGQFLWIAESDDSCELDFLEKQLATIADSEAVVAKTVTFSEDGINKEIVHPAFKDGTTPILDNDSLLYCPILNVSTTVFRAIDSDKLKQAAFTEFPIIGDRVFYYEFFQQKKIQLNNTTTSYFRQEGTGLSNLETKGLSYLTAYFYEHLRFIKLVQQTDATVNQTQVKKYIHRFFCRVRDRLSRSEKLSYQYFKLYLYYRFKIMQVS